MPGGRRRKEERKEAKAETDEKLPYNNSKTFAKKSISIANCRRRQTSDSCNTTCNMQHATSIYLSVYVCICVLVCGENNKHNGHILYFRQCAPRACNKKQRAIVNKDAA